MTRAWAQFWTAMAVMVVAAATWAMASRGLNIGSAGEWVGGLGAFAAAGTAVWIADGQRRNAASEAEAQRRKASQTALSTAVSSLKTALICAGTAETWARKDPKGARKLIRLLMQLPQYKRCAEAMDQFPMHSIGEPETFYVFADARAAVSMIHQTLFIAISVEVDDDDDDDDDDLALILDFESEKKIYRGVAEAQIRAMATERLPVPLDPRLMAIIDRDMLAFS